MSEDNEPGEICTSQTSRRSNYVVSPRRDAAKRRVRKWKRNKARWLALRVESFSGETFANLLEGGRARPFELGGDVEHDLRRVLSPHAVLLLRVVLACERGFGGNRGGVRMAHATAARIAHCSERTAGQAMRELAAVGLVEVRWHFTQVDHGACMQMGGTPTGGRKHREHAACYSTTDTARAFCAKREAKLARSNQVGKKNQPSGFHRSLRLRVKGARGRGRPERSFVEAVLRARQVKTAPPAVARVIERLPDGRVRLGSPLVGGVGRLANASVATELLGRAKREAEAALEARDPVAFYASFWTHHFDDKPSGGGGS